MPDIYSSRNLFLSIIGKLSVVLQIALKCKVLEIYFSHRQNLSLSIIGKVGVVPQIALKCKLLEIYFHITKLYFYLSYKSYV